MASKSNGDMFFPCAIRINHSILKAGLKQIDKEYPAYDKEKHHIFHPRVAKASLNFACKSIHPIVNKLAMFIFLMMDIPKNHWECSWKNKEARGVIAQAISLTYPLAEPHFSNKQSPVYQFFNKLWHVMRSISNPMPKSLETLMTDTLSKNDTIEGWKNFFREFAIMFSPKK